jgi:hypothetical protein
VLFFVALCDEWLAVGVVEVARAVTRRQARAEAEEISYSHDVNDERSSPRPSMFGST